MAQYLGTDQVLVFPQRVCREASLNPLNPRVAGGTAPKPQSPYLSLPSILLLQLPCPSPGSKLQPLSFSPGITSSRKPYLNRHPGVRSPFSVHPLCVGFAPP